LLSRIRSQAGEVKMEKQGKLKSSFLRGKTSQQERKRSVNIYQGDTFRKKKRDLGKESLWRVYQVVPC